MTPVEKLLAASRSPFQMAGDNCAHAVAAALSQFPKARMAASLLQTTSPETAEDDAARVAAAAGMHPTMPWGMCPAWGLAWVDGAYSAAARIDGVWWRRGRKSIHRVKDDDIISAWSVV